MRNRRVLRGDRRVERDAYTYMSIATPIVFGAFGSALGWRHDRLRSAHAQIEQMHGELCAIAAHDLRTPITTLLLHFDLLRTSAKDGLAHVRVETLEQLAQTAQVLNRIVSDLLDATRIEAAKLRLDMVPTSLSDAVSALVERLSLAVGDHALELAVEGSPPSVMADPMRLDRIVTNLVENAAKYSPAGTPIRIDLRSERGGATLRVRDRGQGISAADIPHLFERYFQTARAREKKSGLGLGLYITKGLVEAHGGTIAVESEVNRGSTFSVWFPAARVAS